MSMQAAWFWSHAGCALFLGLSGKAYPNSNEIQPCNQQSADEACDVFTRQVAPYAQTLIPKGRIPTLYFKTVHQPIQ